MQTQVAQAEFFIASLGFAIRAITEELNQGFCFETSMSLLLGQLDELEKRDSEVCAFLLSFYRECLLKIINKIDVHKFHVGTINSDETSELDLVQILHRIYELDLKFPNKDALFLTDLDIAIIKMEEIKQKIPPSENNAIPVGVADDDEDYFVYPPLQNEQQDSEEDEEEEIY